VTALYDWLAAQSAAGRIPAMFSYAFAVRGMLAVLLLAPLLGGMSHLVVARRLALFSAALGQAALTGLALGLALGEPLAAPTGGILGFCLASAVLMVFVRRHGPLTSDTLIGVFLSMTLGLGICLLVAVTKRFNIHQIEAVMFGSILTVTDSDLLALLVVGAAVGALVLRHYNHFVLDGLNSALGRLAGADAAKLEYGFAVLLTIAIVVSLKVTGALLVEALLVIPAAAGRNLARSLRSYLVWSALVAVVAGEAGIAVSTRWEVPSGGAVVLALSALFVITLTVRLLRPSAR
jgi:zinc transport system permease protein